MARIISSMKYDDASWHWEGDFPAELPDEAGATHIGMFAAWACLNGLAGSLHTDEFPDELQRLAHRTQTPGAWFLECCDGKLTDEDFSDEGNRFAKSYYASAEGQLELESGSYLTDYAEVFDDSNELYAVPDTWASYDRLKPILDRRLVEWRLPPRTGLRKLFR